MLRVKSLIPVGSRGMPEEESPKLPDGLETAGRQLWDSVTASFVLNAGEVEILRQAAAAADEIVLLEVELRRSSLVVAGYAGQPRPNPLLKIIQDHRILLRRLVDSLNLPDEGEESGLRPGQRHARTAAVGRWKSHVPNGKLAELRAAEWGRDGAAS
jgi:hypothetical protein